MRHIETKGGREGGECIDGEGEEGGGVRLQRRGGWKRKDKRLERKGEETRGPNITCRQPERPTDIIINNPPSLPPPASPPLPPPPAPARCPSHHLGAVYRSLLRMMAATTHRISSSAKSTTSSSFVVPSVAEKAPDRGEEDSMKEEYAPRGRGCRTDNVWREEYKGG